MIKTVNVTEAYLRSIPVPPDTDTYKAVSNGDVIDMIDRNMLSEGNLKRVSAKFKSAARGGIVVGTLHYRGVVDDLGLSVAFVNSYNKMRVLKIGYGSVVWVCENGMLSAEFSIERKHTGYIKLEMEGITNGLSALAIEEHRKNVMQRDEMSRIVLSPRDRAEYYGRLIFEESLLTPLQISSLITELANPKGNFKGNTLWDAYNNVTQVLKTSHPVEFLENHMELHASTQNAFSLTI